jgi:bifunctional non-homologous end joining protein LigD
MLLDSLDKENNAKLVRKDFPEWYDPMLATLSHEVFSREGWIYERKLDGERCIAYGNEGNIRLMSRNKKDISRQYPEICDDLSRTGFSFVADGEIVALGNDDISFSRLKRRMHVEKPSTSLIESVPVCFYLFDILYLDGFDTRNLDQLARKDLLRNVLDFSGLIRYTYHHTGDGIALFHEACGKGWEGLIAKDPYAPYIGKRSDRWLKFKCSKQQEFIVCGYTKPRGGRAGFGALLLGYLSGDRLVYAGKVGTGFDEKLLEALGDLLKSIEAGSPPIDDAGIDTRDVRWVEPVLICKVSFAGWTESGRLRHPVFIGLKAR